MFKIQVFWGDEVKEWEQGKGSCPLHSPRLPSAQSLMTTVYPLTTEVIGCDYSFNTFKYSLPSPWLSFTHSMTTQHSSWLLVAQPFTTQHTSFNDPPRQPLTIHWMIPDHIPLLRVGSEVKRENTCFELKWKWNFKMGLLKSWNKSLVPKIIRTQVVKILFSIYKLSPKDRWD